MALADADTITLDPPAVAVNRTRLALSGALTFGLIDVMEADYGNAEVEQFLSARRYGEIPVGHRLPNRTVEYGLRFQAVSGAGVSVGIRAVQRKVATFQAEGGWLGRTLAPRTAGEWGTDVLYADVVDASLSLPSDWMAQRQEVYLDARLTLTVLPDFYGAEVAAGSANSSGENDSVSLLGTIGGDYPARSRYTVTDTGSLTRKTVWIGSQAATYGTAATEALAYEAEALTALDLSTKPAITGAHGGTAVANATVSPTWTPILSTAIVASGEMTHWGNYRLLARCYSDVDAEIRIEYSVGDAVTARQNNAASIPGSSSTAPAFHIRDLGEIRIPKVPVGTQRWQGRIFARSDSSGVTVGVDKVWLVPMESISIVSGRRDPAAAYVPSVYLHRHTFSGGTAYLTGTSLDLGGTWSGAGDTDDFYGTASSYAKRTAISDANYTTGRYLYGTASATDVTVQGDVKFTANTTSNEGRFGVVARYVDTSNFVHLYLDGNASGTLKLVKYVAGNPVTLGQSTPSGYIGVTNLWYTLRLTISSLGEFAAYIWAQGYPSSTPSFTGSHKDLATGGDLATGKTGIYDVLTGSNGITRGYDNFSAFTIEQDGAVLSGKKLSARHDGAWRETATSGIYAPAHVEGSYPRDPVAGIESRVTRTLIVPSAGDIVETPDADPTAWNVTRHYSPTYLFVPEA